MKYTFGDSGDSGGRAARIRELFHGGTIAAHTEICIDNDVWTDSELRGKALRACKEEVRTALSTEVDGLPWAGETPQKEEGSPVWRQLDLWDFETYVFNINRRKVQTGADVEVINRMAERCYERFGKAPRKTKLVEIKW
jgi:hypothetical protein